MDKGTVFWLTGLAGSGKTTIAQELVKILQHNDKPVVFLDGDRLRAIFGATGYTRDARYDLAFRYANLYKSISDNGVNVVCAVIALFHDIHAWNRQYIENYFEVLIDVPLDEIFKRDKKGLYSGAKAGRVQNVVGMDIEAEFPENPDLVVNNFGNISSVEAAKEIYKTCDLSLGVH